MSLHNLTHIGRASLVWNQGKFSLSIDWEQEVPPARQVDITVFLLELFRNASSRDNIRYDREHTRISTMSEHLYGFEIVEVNPIICEIYSTDELENLPSINPHDVTLLPYSRSQAACL